MVISMPAPMAEIRNKVSALIGCEKHFGSAPELKPISKVRLEQDNHCLSALLEQDSISSHK